MSPETKISEVGFLVLFNKEFVKLLDLEPEQIAWMAREAGSLLTVSQWDSNEAAYAQDEDLDCWHHDMLVKDTGQRTMFEGVPFPKGYLTLWLKGHPKTLPRLGDKNTMTMRFPEDFRPWLNRSKEELGVFRVDEE